MNGGVTGAYHIDADWGDSQLASMFGSNAVAWGSEYAREVLASMQEVPEQFNFPGSATAASERGTCAEKCGDRGMLSRPLCEAQCQVQDFAQVAAVFVIGVGLVLIGALALTRG